MSEHAVVPPPVAEPTIELPRLFAPVQEDGVRAFLRDHPFLLPLLVELRRQVDTLFGPWAPVLLDLRTDPDEGDTALFARIQSDAEFDESMRRLDRLYDAWWLDALPRGNDMLNVGFITQ